MKTIAAEWARYRAEVVPATAHATQVQETRRAFYAGVHAMYQQLLEIGGDDVDEFESHDHLEAVADELAQFKKDVEEGRA